ncbi:MAG: NigD-like N-terminal domain-containing protein [Prevotella sp.]|nr:NigD-like N-terminal domain-containing protein [Bacteroidaceae bacterium]MBR1415238.1 NigD-like N-terminal domain-containing protein [Prevotella sp.]
MNKIHVVVLSCIGCLLSLASCTIDAYDKGEGELSLMTAELVEAHVGSDKYVESVETDQGERLTMQPGLTAQWIEKADTTYRALLYYNKVETGKAEAVSFGRVGVLLPRDSVKGGMKTDPLYVESSWIGKNRKYLNLRMRLLTGSTTDEHAQHSIGLIVDTLASTPSHACMTLYHDQGGRPEYYSATTYASIPLAEVDADTLTLSVVTYDGLFTRTFPLR